ncbi:HAD-IIIC family phosphatase [Sulfidibacter corallicola]|uniref:HAD-IIIC family phosphatase n=1 Tax=Sulfidibacter corallicola TaxID=2818388 RepID=A0A8A4TEQ0_SULCO|nr:HAD-IIIC family phosphatase [Sulfidibacter corallicola]QTD48017.1 HAD-IIIC family phosphatase [Sulfidibacter corallicola]
MSEPNAKCLILSDFNAENLGALLTNCSDTPALDLLLPDFGRGLEILFVGNHPMWDEKPDYAFVWTRAEGAIKAFQKLLDGQDVKEEDLLAEVDDYAAGILNAAKKARAVFVASWTAPYYRRGLGMLDYKPGVGYTYFLTKMNLHLAEKLGAATNVFLLNAERWVQKVGTKGYSPKLWYMGKVPFSNGVFNEAVIDLKAGVRGLLGQARKLIVLDLDNTTWGGIVGDDGWENLHVGGHDPVGEAHVDFQHRVKEVTRRGIVLGISSKNEESVAMEAIEKHPEMVLRKDDFAGWRINWMDKASNIADLVKEINLGLQSVVFLDDNPTERARVREALPEVFVPEWPKNALNYAAAFQELALFDIPAINPEDRKRAEMYVAERKRSELREGADMSTWLSKLEIKAEVENLNDSNQQRTVQLLNKTNQMNLTTRRLTQEELIDWIGVEGRSLWTLKVSDKYGDYGLTGIVSVDYSEGGDTASIVDFILSCRVFGKNIEQTMLHLAVQYGRSMGAKQVRARYLETKKNKPCRTFFENSGMTREGDIFSWDVATPHPPPEFVQIIQN